MWLGGVIAYQLPSLILTGSIPLSILTMLYFYKKTDRAIIATTEVIAKPTEVEVKLPNGKVINCTKRTPQPNLKFALIAVGDEDTGEIKEGTKLDMFKITAVKCTDRDTGKELDNLYWGTIA